LPDALPATPENLGTQFLAAWGPALEQAPSHKAARANDCLFDSTMATYMVSQLASI
jgi:hypothetical protein